jgi:hypothetical protein
MMKIFIIKSVLIFMFCNLSFAKLMTRCELVNILTKANVGDIFGHVCSAMENRDSKDTDQSDGTSLGIYSINRNYWCDKGPNVGCGIPCNNLLDDDIRDDISCAQLIMNTHGTNAWNRNCNSKTRDAVNLCTSLYLSENVLQTQEEEVTQDPQIDIRGGFY